MHAWHVHVARRRYNNLPLCSCITATTGQKQTLQNAFDLPSSLRNERERPRRHLSCQGADFLFSNSICSYQGTIQTHSVKRVRWRTAEDPPHTDDDPVAPALGPNFTAGSCRWLVGAVGRWPSMIYNDGGPRTTESRRASSCRAVCKGDICNRCSAVAAASKSSANNSTTVQLIECVCTIRAALLRATSRFRAHCPLFWPQMTDECICKARRHTLAAAAWQLRRDLPAAPARLVHPVHVITGVLEATALPSAARERVF